MKPTFRIFRIYLLLFLLCIELLTFNSENGTEASEKVLPVIISDEVPHLVPPIGHTFPISVITYSPNGNYVLSGARSDKLILWEAETGREVLTFGDRKIINSAAFSPDGEYIVTGGEDIVVWDVYSKDEVQIFKGKGQ